LAAAIAASSSSKPITGATGPKISSFSRRASADTPASTVGSKK
jgi:hypothetical protein